MLEREMAGYQMVGGFLAPVTDLSEMDAVDAAIRDPRFPGVREHIDKAVFDYSFSC